MSDVKQRKQRSQNNRYNEHNSDKTKKNFTGFYTKVNPNYSLAPQETFLVGCSYLHIFAYNVVTTILYQLSNWPL